MANMTTDPVEILEHQPSKMIADHDLMGEKLHVTHSEALHFGELTQEEKVRDIRIEVICTTDSVPGSGEEAEEKDRFSHHAIGDASVPSQLHRSCVSPSPNRRTKLRLSRKQLRRSSSAGPGERSPSEGRGLPDRCLHSLRGIHSWSGSLEPTSQPSRQAQLLSRWLHNRKQPSIGKTRNNSLTCLGLGSRLPPYQPGQECWWHYRLPICPRSLREPLLRRRHLLPEQVVHKVRAELPDELVLLRQHDLRRLWKSDCRRHPLRSEWHG